MRFEPIKWHLITTLFMILSINQFISISSRALQLPPEAWLRMSIGNCGITRITIRPNGRVSIKGLGDTGHLPPEMITFN